MIDDDECSLSQIVSISQIQLDEAEDAGSKLNFQLEAEFVHRSSPTKAVDRGQRGRLIMKSEDRCFE